MDDGLNQRPRTPNRHPLPTCTADASAPPLSRTLDAFRVDRGVRLSLAPPAPIAPHAAEEGAGTSPYGAWPCCGGRRSVLEEQSVAAVQQRRVWTEAVRVRISLLVFVEE